MIYNPGQQYSKKNQHRYIDNMNLKKVYYNTCKPTITTTFDGKDSNDNYLINAFDSLISGHCRC